MIRSFEIVHIGAGLKNTAIILQVLILSWKNYEKTFTFNNNNNGAERRILDLQIIKEQIESDSWLLLPQAWVISPVAAQCQQCQELDLECNPTLKWAGDKKLWQQQRGFPEKHRIFGQSFAVERVSVQRRWETCWADCLLGFQMF